MEYAFETLLVERSAEHVLTVTLNRPHAANAINTLMGTELREFWTNLRRDCGDIRCVVVTGAGNAAFCAGGDLKERNGMSDADWRRQHEIYEDAYWTMMESPVPVIAAVNGHAFGGGLEMVLAADFAYGSATARFRLPETSIGIMPGVGGTQNLPRIVGERRAKEIILAAAPFSAAEALDWGILNGVREPDELMPTVLAIAARIAKNAPLATRYAKKAIHEGLQTDIRTALRMEVEIYNRLTVTNDRLEGVLAFNEKRDPVFQGN